MCQTECVHSAKIVRGIAFKRHDVKLCRCPMIRAGQTKWIKKKSIHLGWDFRYLPPPIFRPCHCHRSCPKGPYPLSHVGPDIHVRTKVGAGQNPFAGVFLFEFASSSGKFFIPELVPVVSRLVVLFWLLRKWRRNIHKIPLLSLTQLPGFLKIPVWN